MSSKQNALTKAILSRKHPDYDQMVPEWNMFEDTYKGGRAWFAKHIHKYHKEGEDEFSKRLDRAYRFNHPKEVVDLVGKYIFRAEISRKDDAPESLKSFWKRMSKRGWPVDEMMPVLNRWASVFGRIWVVVDATNHELGPNATAQQLKDAGYRVWCYWVRPQDMLDCAYNDDTGELEWVLLRESYRSSVNPLEYNGGMRTRYRLWTRESWTLYQDEIKDGKSTGNLVQVKYGEHNLGVVPVLPLDNITSNEDYTSPSMICDIAYLDKAVANYLSNLDAIIQDQTFSQLAMPAQAAMFGETDEDVKNRNNMVEMGTKRVFLYDAESNKEPFYLSPDPKQAELIIKAISQIINEIYHSVGVAGERTKQDNSQGIDNSSGVAKAYDFDRVNSLLTNKGKTLERFENQLCDMVLRWHNETSTLGEDDSFVTYPESFDTRGFSDELNISERLEMITAPLAVKQHQLKRAIKKLYPFMDEKTRKELESAIDEMEDVMDLPMKAASKDFDPSNQALPNEQNQGDDDE